MKEEKKELTLEEIRRKGGRAFKEKYGSEGFAELGKKGQEAIKKKYGPEYYSRIGKISAEKRRARALERKKLEEVKTQTVKSQTLAQKADSLLESIFGIKK